jgi:hypothetical protein
MSTTNITISSSAVLVDLNISVWTGRKMDKKVSAEIDADKQTQVRAGNYHKALMAGAKELEDINKYAAGIRNWHTQQTLPWSDAGTRLIPTARLFDYQQELGQRENGFQALVTDFLAAYNTLVQAAQFRLGALFDADEYPDVDVIAAKFGFRYVFSPLPTAGDFRVDIGNEGLAELRSQYEENQNRYIQGAMTDAWNRTRDVVEKLSNQLRVDKNTGEKGKLYQSTLDNALELCDMLKSMNITGDQELEKIRKELYMTLNGVELKEIKKDDAARAGVKSELDALISKFSF